MRLLLLTAVVALAACSTVDSQFASSANLFSRVSGTWAVLDEGKVDCKAATETISFSKDFSVATFRSTEKYSLGNGKQSDTITYKILKVQDSMITMFLNGETRTTDGGDPIVWSLVLLQDGFFVWRRTDWPAGDSTIPRARCDG
jgi:hypothetical protein